MTAISRDKYFNDFKDVLKDYNYKIIINPPEIISLPFLKRNPVVLMHDMAKKVPDGAEYDDYVIGLYSLAYTASCVPLFAMYDEWWSPVSDGQLGHVIGQCDTDWKKEMLKIWMDADYTKSHFD